MKTTVEIDNLIRAAAAAAQEALPGLLAERRRLIAHHEELKVTITLLQVVNAAAQRYAAR